MATVVRKFDVTTPRPVYKGQPGEVWWHRIGNGIENDKGQIVVWLDSLPLTDIDSGKTVISLFEKREEDERFSRSAKPAAASNKKRPQPKDEDDEIPF